MAFVRAAKTHDSRLTSQQLVERIAEQFNLTVHARSVERALARKKKPGSKGNKGHDADEA
jgi:hypothetical protein